MKIGLIGTGKMGSALLEGILRAKLCAPDDVTAFDPVAAALASCRERHGIHAASSNREVFERSDAVLLCVKPQDCRAVLEALPPALPGRLLISIAAGLPIQVLERWISSPQRLVRVMPNTPSLIGKGAAAFAPSAAATHEDRALTQRILESVGLAVEVRESQLDAVTGLSGSGPAYVFALIEALADGGVLEGLPKPLALQLAAQTVAGAAELMLQTGLHPAQLKDQVTSPGGTTIAGLFALEQAGFRAALMDAVATATEKSKALGAASAASA